VQLGIAGRAGVVTGASQGIGLAIARALAAEGASLVICARGAEKLERAADELRHGGAAVLAVAGDVTDPELSARLVEGCLGRFGRLDILVNNAGKGAPVPLAEQTTEQWRASFELNLFSAVRLSLACAAHMCSTRWGRIVNIGSRVGREPDPYFAPYAAAKAALMNFTHSLSDAFARHGVTANCVVPGLIRSQAVHEAAEQSAAAVGASSGEVMAEMLRRRPIPAGRLGDPGDVAGLVVYLCSEQAGWTTGSSFTVDGGISRSPL
jgi:3-oxoacyl-[acyl-carrier protein] reductase